MNGVGFDSSAVRGPRCYGLTSFAVEDRPGSTLPTFAQCKTSSREENDGSLLPAHGDTMTRYLFLALLAISSTASAVVIRGDVDDAEYRIPAAAFPALADMPGEGHGVLIAPQWVVTAAHAAPMQGMDADVAIGGVARRVECVITHPRYARLPGARGGAALASGKPYGVHSVSVSFTDNEWIKLESPVDG